MANLEPGGTRSLESALILMAMAYGPIPGVEATKAEPGTVASVSPALRVVRDELDQLTPDQRAVVERYLAEPADAETVEIRPASDDGSSGSTGAGAMVGGGVAQRYDNYQLEVIAEGERVMAHAQQYWDGPATMRLRFYAFQDYELLTFFNPTAGASGLEQCDVFINTAKVDENRFLTRRSLTLDIVHCFQSWEMGTEAGQTREVPGWAWEGPAEYVVQGRRSASTGPPGRSISNSPISRSSSARTTRSATTPSCAGMASTSARR